MNERTKQLAEQADLYARSDNSSMLFENWKNRYTERLTELIVQDCAKVAEDIQTFYDEHNDSVVNTEIWTMIKLHFGVE